VPDFREFLLVKRTSKYPQIMIDLFWLVVRLLATCFDQLLFLFFFGWMVYHIRSGADGSH
jgi:hypothetical protein